MAGDAPRPPAGADADAAGRLLDSWDANAAAWTLVVREGRIPSRRAGTDAAIVTACAARPGLRALDVGCGEGWLARALAAAGADVLGVDASRALVAAATAAGSPGPGRVAYEARSYAELAADDGVAAGPFALIVCNFALLDDDPAPLFAALGRRLTDGGRLLVQTVHPFAAAGAAGYVEGWREETFAGFGGAFPATMPWYFHTMASWSRAIARAGLRLAALEEPRGADGTLLSLLLTCVPGAPR